MISHLQLATGLTPWKINMLEHVETKVMEVWFRWFSFPNWVILSFHVNFQGCSNKVWGFASCSNIFGTLEPNKKKWNREFRRHVGTCWMTCRYVKKQPNCLVNLVSRGNCSKPVFTFLIWCYLGNGNFGNYIWIKACMKKTRFVTADRVFPFRALEKSLNSLRGRGFPWA